jgi:hypothetical protein
MTHSGNNNWYGEHEQTISKDDEDKGVTLCCNALVSDMFEGKEYDIKKQKQLFAMEL